jgi:hypothetical protein
MLVSQIVVGVDPPRIDFRSSVAAADDASSEFAL